jgi:LPS export ABC transporter protein LptC
VTQAGTKKWRIFSEEAVYFQDNSGATLKGVRGQVFGENAQPVADFASPTGEYHQQDNQVVLNGGVLAHSADAVGVTLKAPTIAWSTKSDHAQAMGGVFVDRKGFGTSQAKQASFTLDFSNLSLEGQAKSELSFTQPKEPATTSKTPTPAPRAAG